jgi:hypothetical protein
MKYINYKSLTWWSGVASIALGTAMLAGINHPAFGPIGEVLAALTGGVLTSTSPGQFIIMGITAIGLRAAVES